MFGKNKRKLIIEKDLLSLMVQITYEQAPITIDPILFYPRQWHAHFSFKFSFLESKPAPSRRMSVFPSGRRAAREHHLISPLETRDHSTSAPHPAGLIGMQTRQQCMCAKVSKLNCRLNADNSLRKDLIIGGEKMQEQGGCVFVIPICLH